MRTVGAFAFVSASRKSVASRPNSPISPGRPYTFWTTGDGRHLRSSVLRYVRDMLMAHSLSKLLFVSISLLSTIGSSSSTTCFSACGCEICKVVGGNRRKFSRLKTPNLCAQQLHKPQRARTHFNFIFAAPSAGGVGRPEQIHIVHQYHHID